MHFLSSTVQRHSSTVRGCLVRTGIGEPVETAHELALPPLPLTASIVTPEKLVRNVIPVSEWGSRVSTASLRETTVKFSCVFLPLFLSFAPSVEYLLGLVVA